MRQTRRQFCAAAASLFSGTALLGCGQGDRTDEKDVDPTKPLRFSAKVVGKCVGHTGFVTHVAISPDGKTAVSGPGYEPYIRFWSIPDGKEIRKIQYAPLDAKFPSVKCLQISADGKWLAATLHGGEADRFRLWEMPGVKELEPGIPQADADRLEFSSDNTKIATYGGRQLQVWEVNGWRKTREAVYDRKELGRIRGLSLTPDGKHVGAIFGAAEYGKDLARDDVPQLRVVNVSTGKEVFGAWKGGAPDTLAFSADGRLLAVAGEDAHANGERIRTWDWRSGRLLSTIVLQNWSTSGVRFHPDRPVLVVGDHTGAIQAWDVAKERKIAELTGHHDQVHALVFSKDGKTLISGSRDRTLLVWEVDCR